MATSLINEVTKNRNNIRSLRRELCLLGPELFEVLRKIEGNAVLLQEHARLLEEIVESVGRKLNLE